MRSWARPSAGLFEQEELIGGPCRQSSIAPEFVPTLDLRGWTRSNGRMSVFAQLADHLHYALICKRAAHRLRRRLVDGASEGQSDPPGGRCQRAGIVAAAQGIEAPLTGTTVVGYRVLIELVSRYWMNRRVLVDYCDFASFRVEGLEGRYAVVGGDAVHLIAVQACSRGARAAGSSEEPRALPEEIATVLARRAQLRIEPNDPRPLRWCEYHLHEGDEVFVDGWSDGTGVALPRAEQGTTSEACELVGTGNRPLLVSRIPRHSLLSELREPDEALLRALPPLAAFGEGAEGE